MGASDRLHPQLVEMGYPSDRGKHVLTIDLDCVVILIGKARRPRVNIPRICFFHRARAKRTRLGSFDRWRGFR